MNADNFVAMRMHCHTVFFLLLRAISYLNYADYGEQRADDGLKSVLAVLGRLHRVVVMRACSHRPHLLLPAAAVLCFASPSLSAEKPVLRGELQ